MNRRFPFGRTFLLGFGFFGISLIWPIFNNFVPVFLREEFGLSATLIGFIMTWDNYLNMFVQPIVGERSDQTRTRLGRRKPWMLIGAPLAAVFFILVPVMGTMPGIMIAILLTNLSMALFRSPTIALLGDLFPSQQRSTANGIINLMGGRENGYSHFGTGINVCDLCPAERLDRHPLWSATGDPGWDRWPDFALPVRFGGEQPADVDRLPDPGWLFLGLD